MGIMKRVVNYNMTLETVNVRLKSISFRDIRSNFSII